MGHCGGAAMAAGEARFKVVFDPAHGSVALCMVRQAHHDKVARGCVVLSITMTNRGPHGRGSMHHHDHGWFARAACSPKGEGL